MMCPDCHYDAMEARYITVWPTPVLDGPPTQPQKQPDRLVCRHCGSCYYVFHGETEKAAWERIMGL